MKIVIEVPDGCYEELCSATFPAQDAYRLVAWICDGTPLPKGHEYIDRNNAITSICQWFTTAERNRRFSFTTNLVKQTVADILRDEPSIIETDGKEGE